MLQVGIYNASVSKTSSPDSWYEKWSYFVNLVYFGAMGFILAKFFVSDNDFPKPSFSASKASGWLIIVTKRSFKISRFRLDPFYGLWSDSTKLQLHSKLVIVAMHFREEKLVVNCPLWKYMWPSTTEWGILRVVNLNLLTY